MFIGSISKNLVYPDAPLQSRVKLMHSTSTLRTMTTTHLLDDGDWLLVGQDKTPTPPPTPLFKLSDWLLVESPIKPDDGVVIKYQVNNNTNLNQEWFSPSGETKQKVMMAELAGSNC